MKPNPSCKNQRAWHAWLALALVLAVLPAAASDPKPSIPSANPAGRAGFAPLSADQELAAVWNDPDFQRRLIGSYGFLSGSEPIMSPEDQQFYNERIRPLLEGDSRKGAPPDRKKAIPVLESRLGSKASAQFDYLLGTILFEEGDLTNAVRHFEVALTKFPDFRRAQKNLAFALVRDGRYAEAILPLTRTVALGGGDGKVFGLLGFAYMSQGRFVSAEGAYRQAIVFEPDNLEFKLGLVKCAVETAHYQYALGLLDELIQQYPERDNLWTLQANIYTQLDQPARAGVTLEMLRRLDRATPANLYMLGDLYMVQEARDLALGAYLEALERDGGENPARALRPAQILVSRGAWVEARRLFAEIRKAGDTLSADDSLKLLKLESQVAMSTGEGDQAIRVLEEIIQRDPLDGEALLLAGDFYAKGEDPQKAAFRYDAASKIEGFEADAWVKHAQLLVQHQKYPQAAELLRKAQKSRPRDNVQRYLEKIEALARGGRS
jgi:tetratricopeptide (TPR) repeat protein